MTQRVIAFCGLAHCGKTTCARYLTEAYGFERIRFAQPMKDMLRAGFRLGDAELDGHLKETPAFRLKGKTPRFALQELGTKWGRDTIDPEIWVHEWSLRVQEATKAVTCDDCRFPNEADHIHALGGILVRITRPGQDTIATSGHESERYATTLPADIELINDGSMQDLFRKIDFKVLHRDLFQEAA